MHRLFTYMVLSANLMLLGCIIWTDFIFQTILLGIERCFQMMKPDMFFSMNQVLLLRLYMRSGAGKNHWRFATTTGNYIDVYMLSVAKNPLSVSTWIAQCSDSAKSQFVQENSIKMTAYFIDLATRSAKKTSTTCVFLLLCMSIMDAKHRHGYLVCIS
jgi:hypothetical protein